MKTLACALLILFGRTLAAHEPAAPPPSVTLAPALDRVLRDYEKYWRAKNPAGLAELFAEDGFVLSNGKPAVRGRAAIRDAYTDGGGPLFLRAFEYSIDGSTGYIIGGYRGQEAGPDQGKFVLALRKDAQGRWLIAADIDNSNQRPRPPQAPNAPPAPAAPPEPPAPTAPPHHR